MGVKAKKNFFDAIDFDEIGDSLDLFFHTIQTAFDYDALGDKDVYNAIVLSPPVPIGAVGNEMSSFIAGVGGQFVDTLPKFTFRARLVETDSAHIFWPDVWDPISLICFLIGFLGRFGGDVWRRFRRFLIQFWRFLGRFSGISKGFR